MRVGYVDCSQGLTGELLLAAGLACGANLERVRAGLARLGLDVAADKAESDAGPALRVRLPESGAGRAWSEAARLLGRAGLAPGPAARARAVVQLLSQAEARGGQLGAADDAALAEIVGNALVLEELGIERLTCSPLNVGGAAAPSAALVDLLRGTAIYSSGASAGLVTAVGAALARSWAQGFGPMPPLRPEASGLGYAAPGKAGGPLRLIVGRAVEHPAAESVPAAMAVERAGTPNVAVIEATVDDLNPQFYGYFAERAFALGALEVFAVAAQMKKGRPGLLITILAPPEQASEFERLLLEETTTIGVRSHLARRAVLDRAFTTVETAYGPIRVKVASAGGRALNAAPEYEDCREAALRHQAPLKAVFQEAMRAYAEHAARPLAAPE
ncbi:MAG TPA: LarC family nickel insertion protein [Terriglobales bacterium]|nr:LarC family nickel insertion protein [Terriglobales bacterium]